jgi:hypothetical protein
MKKILVVFSVLLCSVNSYAAYVSCTEKVTRVHIHKNGGMYFNTETVCGNKWCKLDWQDSNQIDRAYSAMLTSITTDKEMTITWSTDDLNDCSSSIQASHGSPIWIDFF